MLKTSHTLAAAIADYSAESTEEKKYKADFLKLLEHADAFQRTHLPGHITGSAWIVNKARTHTLLVLHAKLGRWLQPGGHADGDEDVLRVALREAEEETGLKNLRVPDTSIFDIDIHPIPARKDLAAHDHYDIRFLIEADDTESLLISDESTDLKWIPLSDIETLTNSNLSVMRLVAKTAAAINN